MPPIDEPPPTDEPIVRRKLSDEVLDRLKRMITSGELRAGDAMPSERALMERFGVGRPAIREAMQALGNMGLLAISQGERAKVRRLTARSLVHQVDLAAQVMLSVSPDLLDHLREARRFFERGMVREAALRAAPGDVAHLAETLHRQRDSLGDADAFIFHDTRFHTGIAAISRNPIFEAVSEAMMAWLKKYRTEMLLWAGREDLTLAEHEEIIRHITAHDPDAAEKAMVGHLDRSNRFFARPPPPA